MSEKIPESPADATRHLTLHVESLLAAGVEWLPSEPLPAVPLNPSPVRQEGPCSAPLPPHEPLPEAQRGESGTARLPERAPGPQTGPAPPPRSGEGAGGRGEVTLPTPAQTALFTAAPVTPSGDAEQRRHALAMLAEQVAGCTRCPALASTRTQTVFGVGPIDPELCFIGEAPGADEDRLGEPFVGAAGQLLTRIINAMGLKREEVYIANILRCRPPGNRPPQPDEAEHCREWLEKTLEQVRPRFICALGNTPARHLLGLSQGITKLRGRFFDYRGTPVMLTFHPSYLLRPPDQEAKKRLVWEDMKTLLTRMGRPIPGKA